MRIERRRHQRRRHRRQLDRHRRGPGFVSRPHILRDIATLKIARFGLSFHIGSNPNQQARKWYDNVVAAKACIGPIAP